MKVSDIVVGKCYHNGKGRVRKVVGETRNESYDNPICVEYVVLSSHYPSIWTMTKRRFAAWAKGFAEEK